MGNYYCLPNNDAEKWFLVHGMRKYRWFQILYSCQSVSQERHISMTCGNLNNWKRQKLCKTSENWGRENIQDINETPRRNANSPYWHLWHSGLCPAFRYGCHQNLKKSKVKTEQILVFSNMKVTFSFSFDNVCIRFILSSNIFPFSKFFYLS